MVTVEARTFRVGTECNIYISFQSITRLWDVYPFFYVAYASIVGGMDITCWICFLKVSIFLRWFINNRGSLGLITTQSFCMTKHMHTVTWYVPQNADTVRLRCMERSNDRYIQRKKMCAKKKIEVINIFCAKKKWYCAHSIFFSFCVSLSWPRSKAHILTNTITEIRVITNH